MRLFPFLWAVMLLLSAQAASAADRSVVFYLDGARIEQEVTAVKGYLEYPLPDSLIPGSLRVKPVGGGAVLRVEVLPPQQDRRKARETASLQERRDELLDRMESLSRREEIFIAAAKAQSGKAPRKSKGNPDPVASIEQGTAYALSQLEAVDRSKRSCQRSIEAVESKLAAARKGAPVARIWLSGKRARLTYQVADTRWTPSYDFRWSGARDGELLLHAKLPKPEKGVLYFVSPGTVQQGAAPQPVRGEFPTLYRYPLTLQGEPPTDKAPLSFSFTRPEAALPPGEAAAFWRGEYLGSGRYAGAGASELSIEARSAPLPSPH